MNTEKIREALEAVNEYFSRVAHDERVTGWVHGEDYGLYCLLADPDCGPQVDEALAELDKAQQPGKVLTDGLELERIITIVRGSDLWRDMARVVPDMEPYENRLHETLVSARNNGYLAPAAGLTVEEAMDVAIKWGLERVAQVKGFDALYDLKARLTAAIEAKSAK